MSVIIADAEARQKALIVQSNVDEMARVCEELAAVFEGVVMPGGGLSSPKVRAAMMARSAEARGIGSALGQFSAAVKRETALYLSEIDSIDSYLY